MEIRDPNKQSRLKMKLMRGYLQRKETVLSYQGGPRETSLTWERIKSKTHHRRREKKLQWLRSTKLHSCSFSNNYRKVLFKIPKKQPVTERRQTKMKNQYPTRDTKRALIRVGVTIFKAVGWRRQKQRSNQDSPTPEKQISLCTENMRCRKGLHRRTPWEKRKKEENKGRRREPAAAVPRQSQSKKK